MCNYLEIQQNLDNCIGKSGKKASHRCPEAKATGKFLSLRAEYPEQVLSERMKACFGL